MPQHPDRPLAPCPWDRRAGKFPGGLGGRGGLGVHSWRPRAWRHGLRCMREGGRLVAGGSRKEGENEGSPSTERVKFPARVRGGKKKGAPILCLGLHTAAPSPQLPMTPTSLGIIALGMRSPGQGSPSPPGPRQQALSPQPPSTCETVTSCLSPAGSATETHTQSLSFSPQALDGGGQASEQPQPGQQRLYHLLPQQLQHKGRSFLLGLGRGEGSGCPILLSPSPGLRATLGALVVAQ